MQVVIYDSSLKIQPGEFLSNYIDMINDPEAWTRYTDVCELDREKNICEYSNVIFMWFLNGIYHTAPGQMAQFNIFR